MSEAIASLAATDINTDRNLEEIGTIDYTLIKIQSPGTEDAEMFRYRKGYFAVNMQTVFNANL